MFTAYNVRFITVIDIVVAARGFIIVSTTGLAIIAINVVVALAHCHFHCHCQCHCCSHCCFYCDCIITIHLAAIVVLVAVIVVAVAAAGLGRVGQEICFADSIEPWQTYSQMRMGS